MNRRIRTLSRAHRDVAAILRWIADERKSQDGASRWLKASQSAVRKLAASPESYGMAPEDEVDWGVKDHTLAELKTLDVGSWKSRQFLGERIPTLAEVLDFVSAGKRLFIEVKCGDEAIPELVRVLSAAKTTREQTVLISLDFDTIVAVKQALPE